MAIYEITAVVANLTDSPVSISPERTEVINTESNNLFADCLTIRDVEVTYEAFWNYLNSDDDVHRSTDKVKVLKVVRREGGKPPVAPSWVHEKMRKSRMY